MSEVITQSIQDYLKHIYELNEIGSSASTNDIAARLNIAPASVTGMLQKLANSKPPLVLYKKHQGVTLTKNGEKAALEVIRHHRLLETFLVNTLGYAWDEVHREADKLEHVISEDFEARMAEALGNPTRDPHGELIPSADLIMPADVSCPLASLRTDETATVKRVSDDDPALLRHLREIGVVPEVKVTVKSYSEFDGNLTIKVEGQKSNIVLGMAVTKQVFVDK
ncbi:MAG TPA: metal-dependent transcriptional regulator [Anaerolineales bacterium]|nr:metal-dependent transcriptional regulator [Anaerolineales bacterium]